MAADPVAAANALAGQTYAGAQERTAATQKALLDNMAATGSYQNTVNQAATTAASPAAPPPPVDANNIMGNTQQALAGAGAQQINTMGHAALAAATALAAHQAQQQAQSAQTFGANAAAALPLEQSRASSMGAQILGDLEAKREAAAAAKAQAAIQLQISQAQLAAENARTAAAQAGSKLTASDIAQGRQIQNQALADISGSPYKDKNGNVAGYSGPLYESAGPNVGKLSGAGHAVEDMISANESGSPIDIMAAAQKYGITPDDSKNLQLIADSVNNYYSKLNGDNYYRVFGGAPPAPVQVPASNGVYGLLGQIQAPYQNQSGGFGGGGGGAW